MNQKTLFAFAASFALFTAIHAADSSLFSVKTVTRGEPAVVKIAPEIEKLFNNTQTLVRQNKFSEAGTELKKLQAEAPKTSAAFRVKLAHLINDFFQRQKMYEQALNAIETALKEKNSLPSSSVQLLLSSKIDQLIRLQRWDAALAAALERLAEPALPPVNVLNLKHQILFLLPKTERRNEMESACRELLNDKSFPDANKERVRQTLTAFFMNDLRDCEKARQFAEEQLSVVVTPNERANLLAVISRCYSNLKNNRLASETDRKIFENETFPASARVNALRSWISREFPARKNADRTELFAAADRVFSAKDIKGGDYYNAASAVIDSCRTYPGADAVKQYSRKILDFPEMNNNGKLRAMWNIAFLELTKSDDPVAAEKTVRAGLALPKLSTQDELLAVTNAGKIISWLGRSEEAKALYKSFAQRHPEQEKAAADLVAKECLRYWKTDDAVKTYRAAGMNMEAARLLPREQALPIVKAILENEKETVANRKRAYEFFTGDTKEEALLRTKYAEFYAANAWNIPFTFPQALKTAMFLGNYPFAVELSALIRGFDLGKNDYFTIFYRIEALNATGGHAEAATLAKEYKAFEKFTPAQRFLLSILAEFDNPNFAKELAAILKATPDTKEFPMKTRGEYLLKAGKAAMIAGRETAASDIYSAYSALFAPENKKVLPVGFSDTPVYNLSDFFTMKNKPEMQKMDRKFGGNMDFLVTDVSTGNRGSGIGSEAEKKIEYNEFTALADENGLHLFIKVPCADPKGASRKIVNVGSFEMYLAPGVNQPYFCFLTDVNSLDTEPWQTTYDTYFHRRIKQTNTSAIQSEVRYGDKEIWKHIFLNWTSFYGRLPENGDLWNFENVHWSPAGGYSWNGTKSIHGRSTWGDLQFNISPAQNLKIKRAILFDAVSKYQAEKRVGRENGILAFWQDTVLGDPAFYEAKVRPLENELDALAARVKPDMSDAEVNEVYNSAVPRWYGLRFLVANLRTEWLRGGLFTE